MQRLHRIQVLRMRTWVRIWTFPHRRVSIPPGGGYWGKRKEPLVWIALNIDLQLHNLVCECLFLFSFFMFFRFRVSGANPWGLFIFFTSSVVCLRWKYPHPFHSQRISFRCSSPSFTDTSWCVTLRCTRSFWPCSRAWSTLSNVSRTWWPPRPTRSHWCTKRPTSRWDPPKISRFETLELFSKLKGQRQTDGGRYL